MENIPGIVARNTKAEYRYFHGLKCPSPRPKVFANKAVSGMARKNKRAVPGCEEMRSKNSCKVMEHNLYQS